VAGDLLAFYDASFRYKTTVRVKAVTGPSCGTMTLEMNRAVAGLNATDQIVDLTQLAGARWIVRHNVMTSSRYVDIGPTKVVDGNLKQGAPTQYGDVSTNDSILVHRTWIGTIRGNHLEGATTGAVGIDGGDQFVLQSSTCPAIEPR
jgi:hypothetical protein